MTRLSLLNVPVYAESHDQFVKQRERKVRAAIADADRAWKQWGNTGAPESKHHEIRVRVEEAWGAWEYSRVVGWFLITLRKGVLEIHVYSHTAVRFSRRCPLHYKLAEYRAHSLGSLHPSARDVPTWLTEALQDLHRTYFSNRWVDWDSVGALIEAVKWFDLMERDSA